jgi:ribonuclease HII
MTVCEPDLKEERQLRREGHEWVAGLDEVGRGAWAGPLTVGVAVVRPRVQLRSMPAWLRDSKMLSEARREQIFGAVGKWLEAWSVGHATSMECDAWGMTEALRVAGQRALAGLGQAPDALLIDGPRNLLRQPGWPNGTRPAGQPSETDPAIADGLYDSQAAFDADADADAAADAAFDAAAALDGEPFKSEPFKAETFPGVIRPIVDGDAKCASVAAASVLAKVVRDRIMRGEADHFPAYGFERNKGYPSLLHQTALRGYGPSAIHRRSWAFMGELPWRGHPCPVRMQISCVDDLQGVLFPAS